MDDKILIGKILDGDHNAVRFMVDSNKNLVWHIIVSMVGHGEDCEDISQEVFLQVFKGLRKFKGDARLSTWIGSITHHVCVDYLRKKKKENDFRNESERENVQQFVHPKDQEVYDLNQVIIKAINNLPPAYRTAITLYHLDERSYKEISEITGMPDGTVKSYINRGRKLLREALIAFTPELSELLNELNQND